jgi:hypothetical protein
MSLPLTPDAMTDAIETACEKELAKAKPNPLPAAGKDDHRLLFAGIAGGFWNTRREDQWNS